MSSGRVWLATFLVWMLIGVCFKGWCAASERNTIRVGLLRFYKGAQSVTLSSDSGLTVTDATGRELISCEPEAVVVLSAEGGVLTIRSGLDVLSEAGSFVTASPRRPTSTVRIETLRQPVREYRGRIEVRPKACGLLLVNVVSVEDYLLGVVSAEMPSSYPDEAIKAQAVTARTYALRNRGKHASDGFDLCDTSNCQIYGGVSVEADRSTAAVRSTLGTVLFHDGRLAHVMYTSDCGGVTQDPSEMRPNSKFPYLRSVTEPPEMPQSSWEALFTLQDVRDKLIAAGVKQAAGLTGIRASKLGASGRVLEFEITTDSGATSISGTKLRSALGVNVIKSLLLSVEKTLGGTILFRGKGSGHGIGLCQVGAKWFASPPRNWNYTQILAYYFPGTEIVVLQPYDSSARTTRTSDQFVCPERKVETKSVPPGPAESGDRVGIELELRLNAPRGL
ncbi:MAG: SpoIID/LytB domain-containing protein [Armatimonadetes bacterium]|nr:SpoIID/LytB domain-containing protein [Armatimonadota bacterium]